jgi:hypothetical protein
MTETIKNLIITGSAVCVLDDIRNIGKNIGDTLQQGVPDIPYPADFMAIGLDAVNKYAWPILYVATYHPEDIPDIRKRREAFGGNADFKIIGHDPKHKEGVDIIINDYWTPSGSSALLGVQAALRMGYRRIIICGCPLTGKGPNGATYENFRNGWQHRIKELEGRVRSMSGWTREFLGSPTEEWLLNGK